MHPAAQEWADRVAARNAVETAKARDVEAQKDAALSAQGFLPFTYGPRPAPLSPEAELAATVARQKEGI